MDVKNTQTAYSRPIAPGAKPLDDCVEPQELQLLPSHSYELTPEDYVAISKIQNITPVLDSGIKTLQSLCSLLIKNSSDLWIYSAATSFANNENKSELISFLKEQITCQFKNLRETIKPNDEERKILDDLEKYIEDFSGLSKLLNEADKYDVDKNLIKLSLLYTLEHIESTYEEARKNNLFSRYEEILKENKKVEDILNNDTVVKNTTDINTKDKTEQTPPQDSIPQGLTSKPIKRIEKLEVQGSPKDKTFIGKVWDEGEGEGLYLTGIKSTINGQGDQLIEPIGLEVSNPNYFNEFSDLSKRSKGQIDIELPITQTGGSSDGAITLPTRLGYAVTDIAFVGGNSSDVIIEKDAFGITYLKNTEGIETVRYRLTKTPQKPIAEIPENWKTVFEKDNSQNNIIDQALEKAKTIKEKVDLVRAKLKTSSPIYTTFKPMEEILSKVPNYFKAQEVLGYIGDCRHQSACLVNELRKNNIVAVCAGGLTTGKSGKEKTFRSDTGHRQVLYLDEKGIPYIEEATSLCDKNHSINEKEVEKDKSKVLQVLEKVKEDKALEYLRGKARDWRIISKDSSKHDFSATLGTPEFRRHLEQIERERTSDNVIDKTKEEIYSKAAQLEILTKEWKEFLNSENLNYIFKALLAIEELTNEIKQKVSKANEPYPIVSKFLENVNPKDYIEEFISWYNSPSNNTNDSLQLELISSVIGMYRLGEVELALIKCLKERPLPRLDLKTLTGLQRFVIAPGDDLMFPPELTIDLNLEIAKQIKEQGGELHKDYLNEAKFIFITSPLRSSEETIAKTCEILRLFDLESTIEEHLMDFIMHDILRSSTEGIQKSMNTFYESKALSKYFQKENDKVVLTPYLKKKVEERLYYGYTERPKPEFSTGRPYNENYHSKKFFQEKPSTIEKLGKHFKSLLDPKGEMEKKYHWDFLGIGTINLELSKLVPNLENLGIDLRTVIPKERAEHIVREALLKRSISAGYEAENPLLYTPGGELNLDKPASLIDANFHKRNGIVSGCSSFGENIAFFSDYFDIDLIELLPDKLKVDEHELWKTKILPKLKDDYHLLSLVNLPKEDFVKVIEHNPLLKTFLERTKLELPQSQGREIINSLFEEIPEAKEAIINKVIEKLKKQEYPCSLQNVLIELVRDCISESGRYRLTVLSDMLEKSGADIKVLQEKLNKAFEETKDEDALEERLKEEILSFLPDSCSLVFKQEIKNELKALSPQELRVFSAVIAEANLQNSQHVFNHWNSISLPKPPKKMVPQDKIVLSKESIDEIKAFDLEKNLDYLLFGTTNTIIEPEIITSSSENNSIKQEFYVEDKGYYTLKKILYPKRGVGLIHKVATSESSSYWAQTLSSMVLGLTKKEEKDFLSTSGEYYIHAKSLAKNPKPANEWNVEPLASNGNVSLIQRTGKSKIYSRADQHGEEFMGYKELKHGDPANSIAKASFRTGDNKLLTSETRDSVTPIPKHFVVDLDFLSGDLGKSGLSNNLHNLVYALCNGLEKRDVQNLHVFYRGELLFSVHNDELKEMLSSKIIDDDYGERTKRTDFILSLNLLAKQARKINDDFEYKHDYVPGISPLSNTEWLPTIKPGQPSRQGTAYVLSNDKDMINKSRNMLFQLWIKRHIDTWWVH